MRWLCVIVAIYGVYVLVGLAIQRRVMFPAWIVPDYQVDESAYPPGVERHELPTDAGTTPYLFIPTDQPGRRGMVVFAHGNAEIIDIWPPLLQPYLDMGLHVLIVEYRGYSSADGRPSERAVTDDFAAALKAMCDRPEVDANRLVYHGRSLGGGIACALARRREPAALILQSTFTSIGAMARRYLYPPWLMRDPMNNAGYLKTCDRPVMLMHGRRDGIITFGHSEKLHEITPHSTLVEFGGAGHNDVPVESDAYWQHVATFLRDAQLTED
jgi:fermentation-respiration switch protein FrsA (DUF1100 family)